MAHVLYGAGGMLLALVILAAGIAIGWKAKSAWIEHTHRAVAEEVTEEEKRRAKAEQQAFESMMNYNADIAYGGRPLDGGDVE